MCLSFQSRILRTCYGGQVASHTAAGSAGRQQEALPRIWNSIYRRSMRAIRPMRLIRLTAAGWPLVKTPQLLDPTRAAAMSLPCVEAAKAGRFSKASSAEYATKIDPCRTHVHRSRLESHCRRVGLGLGLTDEWRGSEVPGRKEENSDSHRAIILICKHRFL